MARYVNLDEAVQRIVDLKLKSARNNIVLAEDEEEIKDWLHRLPAADVQEVRHGRWIWSIMPVTGAIEHKCSVCETPYYMAFAMIMNYCPNCGARMDEVEI